MVWACICYLKETLQNTQQEAEALLEVEEEAVPEAAVVVAVATATIKDEPQERRSTRSRPQPLDGGLGPVSRRRGGRL